MKKAVIVENKGCATCSIGAACLVDGPIPALHIQIQISCLPLFLIGWSTRSRNCLMLYGIPPLTRILSLKKKA